MPSEKLAALEAEHKAVEETNKALAIELKAASAGTCHIIPSCLATPEICQLTRRDDVELAKLKATPTDEELQTQLEETATAVCSVLSLVTHRHSSIVHVSYLLSTDVLAD